MASGNSGSFTISGTRSMSAVCYWSETYDTASNTHVVSIDRVTLKSSNWYGFTYYPDGSISVNGSNVVNFSSAQGSHNCYISAQNTECEIYAGSGFAASPWASGSISGNDDGSCSVTISLSFYGYTSNGAGASGFQINGSTTAALYTVPRKSTVSVPACTMGTAASLTISRASSSFTHTLTYTFGNASGTIVSQTGDPSISWTPPLSLASEIPSSTVGTGVVTCYTYSGGVLIGSTTASLLLSVPADMRPSLSSLSVERIDEDVPSSWGIYVQSKSKAKLTINGASGFYGSTISAYSIVGGGYSTTEASLTTGYLLTSGTVTFTAKVKDSRGRWSDDVSVSIDIVPYSQPIFSDYSVQRCISDGTTSTNGTYCKSTVSFSYSTCNGKNSVTTSVSYKKSTDSGYTDAGASFTSGTAFVFGGSNLAADYSYDIRFVLTDAFGTVAVVAGLSTASVIMDFKAGGLGIGIGKVSETDNLLDVALPTQFHSTVSGSVMSLDGYNAMLEEDFNNYKDPGVYVMNADTVMITLANRPCDVSGTLYVKSAFNDGRSSAVAWCYRVQIFIPYTANAIYLRSLVAGATAGDWYYGAWNTLKPGGNADYATTAGNASNDGNGSNIASTYLPKSGGTVSGTLILSNSTDASGNSDNRPALIVGGDASAAHVEIDGDEIMAKSNGSSPSTLYINHDGGDVYVNGYKNFYTTLIGYGSMSQYSTLSGTVPADTRLFIIAMEDMNAWYTMAVPAVSFTSGQPLHVKATSDYYTFTISFSGTAATLTKSAAGTKTVYFIAIR